MNQSSFPPGRKSIVLGAALFNVRRVFVHFVSLGVFGVSLLVLAFWRHHIGGLRDVLESLLLFLCLVVSVMFLVFFISLFLWDVQKKYLKYKIRRHQLLKKVYKEQSFHEKINQRIDYYQQHLRAIDEELKEEFFLGT